MQVQNFKKTELGEIPEEWTIEKIETFLNINMGQSPSSEFYNQKNVGLPFYQGVTDFNEIHPTPRIWCSDPKKIANENEILFSVRAPVGEINLTNEKCCIGRGVASLIPKNADLIYCFYLLRYFKNKFSTYSQGSTFDAINRSQIANVKVPYTSEKNEQQKIASILSSIDNLIQKTDQVIEQTQRLKKGLMQRLLTKGVGHTKFKNTEVGERPADWDIMKLKDMAISFLSGGTPSTSRSDYWNGDIPWMRSASIKGRYIVSGERFISKLGLDNSASKVIPKDNLILATRVSIGNFAINKIDVAINQDLTGILLDKKRVDLEFFYWLMFELKEVIKSLVQGSTISGLTRDDLKELKIALPSLHEQQKISSILSNIDNLIQKLAEKKRSEEFLKKGLMQQLLTGKIRVKV